MKKVLFVLENLSDKCGANVNLVLSYANYLSDKFEIYALAGTHNIQPIAHKHNDVFKKIYTYSTAQFGEILEFTGSNWVGTSYMAKISRLVRKPKMLAYLIDNKYCDASITKHMCKKAIEMICDENKFDVVIGVSAPYYIVQAISEANIICSKMVIQLDPYANNYTMPSSLKNRREKIENKTIFNLDTVLVADFAYDEMLSYLGERQIKKIKPVALPGVTIEKQDICNKGKIKREDGYVDFVFAGQLYKDIRRPDYLFKLFLYLPDNYRLHIAGRGCSTIVEEYQERLGNRLINHGWVSRDEAAELTYKADVLVNLNNTILNQLPSKLFEYISTGKPILNICKSDKCLSLKYTSKYSNALDVLESQCVEDIVNDIIKFVGERKGILEDKDIILENFRENTNEYFARIIEENISRLC